MSKKDVTFATPRFKTSNKNKVTPQKHSQTFK